MTATSTSLDGAKLREVLGHYPTGVVLVTGTAADGERLAMIVGTFTSVSLEPALVAFLPMRSSGTFARLRECESLCINILSGDQEEVCRTIVARREDKFRDLDWFPPSPPSGDPVLAGSVAWLDVRLTDTIEAGGSLDRHVHRTRHGDPQSGVPADLLPARVRHVHHAVAGGPDR